MRCPMGRFYVLPNAVTWDLLHSFFSSLFRCECSSLKLGAGLHCSGSHRSGSPSAHPLTEGLIRGSFGVFFFRCVFLLPLFFGEGPKTMVNVLHMEYTKYLHGKTKL